MRNSSSFIVSNMLGAGGMVSASIFITGRTKTALRWVTSPLCRMNPKQVNEGPAENRVHASSSIIAGAIHGVPIDSASFTQPQIMLGMATALQ